MLEANDARNKAPKGYSALDCNSGFDVAVDVGFEEKGRLRRHLGTLLPGHSCGPILTIYLLKHDVVRCVLDDNTWRWAVSGCGGGAKLTIDRNGTEDD